MDRVRLRSDAGVSIPNDDSPLRPLTERSRRSAFDEEPSEVKEWRP